MSQIDQWTWTGDSLPSKKNSKNIITLKKRGCKPRPMIVSSAEYLKWEELFVFDIKKLTPIGKWESATFTIYSPDLRSWDLSNKWESLADGMVKAGYITDDNWKCIPNVTLKYGGKTQNKKWVVNAIIE